MRWENAMSDPARRFPYRVAAFWSNRLSKHAADRSRTVLDTTEALVVPVSWMLTVQELRREGPTISNDPSTAGKQPVEPN